MSQGDVCLAGAESVSPCTLVRYQFVVIGPNLVKMNARLLLDLGPMSDAVVEKESGSSRGFITFSGTIAHKMNRQRVSRGRQPIYYNVNTRLMLDLYRGCINGATITTSRNLSQMRSIES